MSYLKLLGTAAGGGFPQWNCACALCHLSRTQPEICKPRLQLQAAVCSGDRWFLLNASPDLRVQIESNPELQPSPSAGERNTPIHGIVLTSADLDQVLGLLLLREFQPLTIYATSVVRRVLEANSFFRMLERVPNQLTWVEITPHVPFQLGDAVCTPIPLLGSLPYYAQGTDAGEGRASLGLVLEQEGRRVVYTPSLPEMTEELRGLYETANVILVDGTFWSDTELQRTQPGAPLARAIGHIPMSGEDGTMAMLRQITGPRKIYVHINNTNPVLNPESAEHRAVLEAGWQIGEDGWLLV